MTSSPQLYQNALKLLSESTEDVQNFSRNLEVFKRQQAEKSFLMFNKGILNCENLAAFQEDVCRRVQNPQKRFQLFLLPRETLKSTLITQNFVLWSIIKNPDIRVLIANEKYDNAKNFLRVIKKQLESDVIKDNFGDFVGDTWSESEIIVKKRKRHEFKEPTVRIAGIGASSVSLHFDLIVADDLVSRENISTPEQIEKVKMFYKDCLDILDKQNGRMIIIGTRWHYGDLYGWLMEQFPDDFEVVKYSLLTPYDLDKGEILWPYKFSRERIKEIWRMKGSYEASCQYQNEPIDDESARFRISWFQKTYTEEQLKFKNLNTYITIDPAIGLEKQNDFTAITVVSVDTQNMWYLRYAKRYKITTPEFISLLFDLHAQFRPIKIGIEETQFKMAIEPFLNAEMRKRNHYMNIVTLKHGGKSKELRIEALAPRFERGGVLFPEKYFDDTDMLKDELIRFPKSAHDDLSDALAYQEQMNSTSLGVSAANYGKKQYTLGLNYSHKNISDSRYRWQ